MTQTILELHPEAIAEARAARRWYADRSPEAAVAFLAELDRAIASIQQSPRRWPRFVHGTRRYLLRRFPYSVIYREWNETCYVIAVMHGRRRPGYWRSRR